ncbi:MAG TPA: hypothetical protein VFD85_14450 [Gemmatimonadales bacterium]|nr:hypothetical protein [Gemmatimonadales bacterium]
MAITALLASFVEAAGEFAYVRVGSMRPAGLDRKVAAANPDRALRIGRPQVRDLAFADHPGERVGVVAGDLCGLREAQELVAVVSEGSLDLHGRPLERAGLGLIAESLSEFLGLGEDRSYCFMNGTGP